MPRGLARYRRYHTWSDLVWHGASQLSCHACSNGHMRGARLPCQRVLIPHPPYPCDPWQANLGLKGLWIGIDTGDFAAAALCVLTWLLVNWKKEVAKAQERMALGRWWRWGWGGVGGGVRFCAWGEGGAGRGGGQHCGVCGRDRAAGCTAHMSKGTWLVGRGYAFLRSCGSGTGRPRDMLWRDKAGRVGAEWATGLLWRAAFGQKRWERTGLTGRRCGGHTWDPVAHARRALAG